MKNANFCVIVHFAKVCKLMSTTVPPIPLNDTDSDVFKASDELQSQGNYKLHN